MAKQKQKALAQNGKRYNFAAINNKTNSDMATKDEETQILNEDTQMVDEAAENAQVEEVEVKKNSKWKKAAGVGAGVVGGAAAGVVFSSMASADNVEVAGKDTPAASHPLQPAGDVKVAQVSDDMSFSEAFASARKQVGAGGVFEWRGKALRHLLQD